MRGGVFAEYRLRWLRNGGGYGVAWDGVAVFVDAGYGVTEWRDST
ncbi:hypothetical protein QNH28_01290 [Paenibacillus sp. G2S3]|nr:hypothetical protein [Paenibacillus sp. G2S3]WHY19707.1 hypothetical protein QNH28_01290 [Paenibacillus sp. G2S3]